MLHLEGITYGIVDRHIRCEHRTVSNVRSCCTGYPAETS